MTVQPLRPQVPLVGTSGDAHPTINKPNAPARCCLRCDHYHDARGECRRKAPVLVVHADDPPETAFPRMQPLDKCGEFRAAVEGEGAT